MAALTDEELAREFQAGNEAAFETLVYRYHARLVGYLFRMSHNYHLAEDIVQECFIRLYTSIGRYKFPAPFKPWVYAIAVNAFRDYTRSAYARRVVPDSAASGCAGSSLGGRSGVRAGGASASSEDLMLRKAERDEVIRALSKLSDIYREVIVLRFYEDLKIGEIAEVLGVPEGTVKSRLAMAVSKLKAAFEELESRTPDRGATRRTDAAARGDSRG